MTVTLTKEEAQQVLDALCELKHDTFHPAKVFKHEPSINLLRARLAQPEPSVEPVAWMYMGIKQDGTTHGPHLCWKPEYMDAMSENKGAVAEPLYTSPPKPKLSVKPAAYVPVHPKSGPLWSMTTDDPNTERLPSYPLMKLYTAPPQPELEPVAYGVLGDDGQIDWTVEYPFSNEPGWPDSVPLYTAPPQYEVPEGYALIGIDALKTWGVYEQVSEACNYSLKEKNI